MKKQIIISGLLLSSIAINAQDGFSEILAGGLEVANDYARNYMTPAAEAYSSNLSTGWIKKAQSLKPGKFSVDIKAQGTFAPDDKKAFNLDPLAYQAIIQRSYNASNNPPGDITVTFDDGSTSPRAIATALGENNPSQFLIVTSRDRTTGIQLNRNRIELAQGLGSEDLNVIPSAFIQAGLGLGAGLEVKARFVPKLDLGEGSVSLYGGALQWEITEAFVGENGASLLPVSISALAGYTRFDGSYDFEDGAVVDGRDQRLDSQASSFVLSAVVGTKFKIINFYGGLNYNIGSTQTDLLGEYTVSSNSVVFPLQQTFVDPITVKTDFTDVTGTVGLDLSLGFFNINAQYNLGTYSTAAASIGFKF